MLRWAGHTAPILAALGTAAVVVNVVPAPDLGASDLSACPMVIGGLRGRDEPIASSVLDELDPSDMIVRSYSGDDPDDRIWLVIAYFENARYGAHNPEVCYRSQGWVIDDMPNRVLERRGGAPIEARQFRVRKGDDERLVAYWWYISDDRVTSDQREFLDSMALQGIIRGSNYGSFVRISTPVSPDLEVAQARLDRFAGRILAELPRLFARTHGGRRS
jgi:EpsI family protein